MVLRENMVADTLIATNTNCAGMWICGHALFMSAVITFIKRADLEDFLETLYFVLNYSIGCYNWILCKDFLKSLQAIVWIVL